MLIEDFDENVDAKFKAEVAETYFKTLFNDVSKRSVTPRADTFPDNFVDNVACGSPAVRIGSTTLNKNGTNF